MTILFNPNWYLVAIIVFALGILAYCIKQLSKTEKPHEPGSSVMQSHGDMDWRKIDKAIEKRDKLVNVPTGNNINIDEYVEILISENMGGFSIFTTNGVSYMSNIAGYHQIAEADIEMEKLKARILGIEGAKYLFESGKREHSAAVWYLLEKKEIETKEQIIKLGESQSVGEQPVSITMQIKSLTETIEYHKTELGRLRGLQGHGATIKWHNEQITFLEQKLEQLKS